MVLPHLAGVVEVTTGDGNPQLDPELREKKIRSGVENCRFFSIF